MRVSVVVVALLALSGCKKISERIAEKAAEKALESATDGKVDLQGKGGVTFTDDKGNVTALGGEVAKVPDNWPSSVPLYPGGKLLAAISANGGKGGDAMHFTLSFETADEPAKVYEYYVTNLKGFKKASELNANGNVIASFEGEGKVVGVTVSKQAATTLLNLIVTGKG